MFENKILFLSIFVLVVLVLIFIMFPLIKSFISDNFTNSSGYGFNERFGKINTLIPLNQVNKSTDFKLFSLMAQIKYNFVKPPSVYEITGTRDGIISRTPQCNSVRNNNNCNKNIILFSGQTDFILRQNDREVWPRNIENINNSKSAVVYENNSGNFNTITNLLENLNYKNGDKLNTITYDFRKINFKGILKQFNNYLKEDTVIIAYDFGAVIANICINKLSESNKSVKNKISKLIMICPTIGGIPMTLRDYFPGNGILDPKIIQTYESVLLSMPNEKLYDMPVAIFNSMSYNANNIKELMKHQNISTEIFEELKNYQNLSIINPGVDTIIIANEQFSTPVCYNFKNDLNQTPERYYSKNNNQFPSSDIQYDGTFEGLQSPGDKLVPISVIYKLKKLWGNNCKIELIKDKDHFTILKSYELALIILANL